MKTNAVTIPIRTVQLAGQHLILVFEHFVYEECPQGDAIEAWLKALQTLRKARSRLDGVD